ncbi:hypothetical protein ACFSKI_20230 [Pseudogracilibacillus auburnensis]|uniref:Uncharacterized protein n=1 Tax=Pseudogracilibacillus auburnensis TaxID=1494959 RepID=A0A2V3VWV3_9BACI|nr:hypothetical protein [Pseudogracilibacillus auburnensis]PXW86493.1 hypothetical protein DFR56_1076 [Pseudogracilibacillus auburnensis]
MQKYFVISLLIISFILLVYIVKGKFVTTTMQYFPIDEQAFFEQANTSISPSENEGTLIWSVESTSNEEAYLRQDVSLLYENGKFKGVLSKWREQVAHLESKKDFPQKNSSFLQAISFHHGEIHHNEDKINSIQQMSTNELYYIHDGEKVHTYHTPETEYEKKWAKKLNEITKQQLLYNWNKLMNDLHIDQQAYTLIPLTELAEYEKKNLPGRSEEETKQIIGQLWEGLYKNYIVLLADDSNDTPHYVPLIMIAKDNSHLLVIFELNNKKQKLIQQLP